MPRVATLGTAEWHTDRVCSCASERCCRYAALSDVVQAYSAVLAGTVGAVGHN